MKFRIYWLSMGITFCSLLAARDAVGNRLKVDYGLMTSSAGFIPLKESKVGTGTLVYRRRLPVLLLPMLLPLLDAIFLDDRDEREGEDRLDPREGDDRCLEGEEAPL